MKAGSDSCRVLCSLVHSTSTENLDPNLKSNKSKSSAECSANGHKSP